MLSAQSAKDLTDCQSDALKAIANNRVSVIRAGPGAGKTRVFVEALRQEIERRGEQSGGVAALSFTNVAHEEVQSRMKGMVRPPHFVGTLDAFMWRFVVRPFGKVAGLLEDGARLLASPLDERQLFPVARFGYGSAETDSVFKMRIAAGDEEYPILTYKAENREAVQLPADLAATAMEIKRKEWKTNGRITHGDTQFLASCILRGRYGHLIRATIARRFPVVLVDEFQDTGWFLGRALLALLSTPTIRGAVVGDPDQAIYKFGGASQSLFTQAELVAERDGIVLEKSHRCPRAVAAVATALSRSGKRVEAVDGAPLGRAVIVVHDQKKPDIDATIRLARPVLEGHSPVVLARRSRIVKNLSPSGIITECPKGCKFARGIDIAERSLVAGEPALAAKMASSELAKLIFNDDDFGRATLDAHAISVASWRIACHRVLVAAATSVERETWNAWILRVKECVVGELQRMALKVDRLGARVKPFGNDGVAVRCRPVMAAQKKPDVEAMTVHQAKGREFPAVLFYSPMPSDRVPCPSSEWWNDDDSSEEREVAFVACSRSKELLILAMHRRSFESMSKTRSGFLDLFHVVGAEKPGTLDLFDRVRQTHS